MNKKRLILFLPLIIFLGMGVFLYQGLFLNPEQLDSALEGKPIPAFQLETLESQNKLITNEDLKGKIAIMNIWATWCPSCKYEHPFLMQLAREQQVPIYGINYRDERAAAIMELAREGDPYALNIYDKDGRLGLDLGVYGAPETYLIDHNGIIRYRHAGPIDRKVWNEVFVPKVEQLRLEEAQANSTPATNTSQTNS